MNMCIYTYIHMCVYVSFNLAMLRKVGDKHTKSVYICIRLSMNVPKCW